MTDHGLKPNPVCGSIVHLNKDGLEREGDELRYLAFLSRYEESQEEQEKSETYRLIVTTEEDFLRFVKLWAEWISNFARADSDLVTA